MSTLNAEGFVNGRLDTWKSIAQHLSRSSRTVQRWYAEYGLPVRHLGGDATSVFAYRDELDEWLRNRRLGQSQQEIGPQELNGTENNLARPSRPPAQLRIRAVRDGMAGPSGRRASELVTHAQGMWKSLSDVNLCEIVRIYREASDVDPANAKAFAGLAQALIAGAVLGQLHTSDAYRPAEAALQRALELDPDLIETRCSAAWNKLLVVRDWIGAGIDLDQILIERPDCGQALIGRGLLSLSEGHLAHASELLREACIQSPLNTLAMALLCWQEYLAGRFENALAFVSEARASGHAGAILDAVEALASVLLTEPAPNIERLSLLAENSPRHYAQLGVLGYAHGIGGQRQKAREAIASMTVSGMGGKRDYAYAMALTFLGLNERETAMEWLDQSYIQGSLWSLGFQLDPILIPLRNDPQTREWFGRMRYPMAQKTRISVMKSKPQNPTLRFANS
jgi:tetratricopeptide (TPR) repeat protein